MSNLESYTYFDSNYGDYERQTSSRKLAFYMSLLHRWIKHGDSIFELGIGKGHFLQKAGKYYECRGCDINKVGLEEAHKRMPNSILYEGSFETLCKESPYKAVIAWDVIEHIEALDLLLETIKDNLSENGLLIGVVPVYDGPLGWLVRRLDKDPTHVWKMSRWQWHEIFQKHGLIKLEWGGIIRRLILSRVYLHIRYPQWILRYIGSAIYFVYQKMD